MKRLAWILVALALPVQAQLPLRKPQAALQYVGYTGQKWERDYGVLGGRCHTEALGGQAAAEPGRAVATMLGSAFGSVIGPAVGREIDATDRACMGHALELAADGRVVAWFNADSGISFDLTPLRGYDYARLPCREFHVRMRVPGGEERVRAAACRRDDGAWELIRPVRS